MRPLVCPIVAPLLAASFLMLAGAAFYLYLAGAIWDNANDWERVLSGGASRRPPREEALMWREAREAASERG